MLRTPGRLPAVDGDLEGVPVVADLHVLPATRQHRSPPLGDLDAFAQAGLQLHAAAAALFALLPAGESAAADRAALAREARTVRWRRMRERIEAEGGLQWPVEVVLALDSLRNLEFPRPGQVMRWIQASRFGALPSMSAPPVGSVQALYSWPHMPKSPKAGRPPNKYGRSAR